MKEYILSIKGYFLFFRIFLMKKDTERVQIFKNFRKIDEMALRNKFLNVLILIFFERIAPSER